MINVIGMGYIGLPTALMLQKSRNSIVGTDINTDVIKKLSNKKITFKEDGLEELFEEACSKGILFTTEYQETNLYIVAVPTPYNERTKQIDCCYVMEAIKKILEVCAEETIVVIESTVSPNTVDKYIRPLVVQAQTEKIIHLVHAPERIIPGNMIYELQNNSRIIGADKKEIAEYVANIYASFCKADISLTSIKVAEMSKVAENTFRDINIAYANELAVICNSSGIDVYEVIRLANKHPRVNILQPGPGVGGHCISVDPWFLVGDYPEITHVIRAAREVNDSMPDYVLEKISDIMSENNINDLSKVGLYGLTYKEDVDDIRESPTLQLLTSMKKHLAYGVKVYDPYILHDIVDNQYHSFSEFIENVQLIVVMVAHTEIIEKQDQIKDKFVFDTKNKLTLDKIYHL